MKKKTKKSIIQRYPMRSLAAFIFFMGFIFGFRDNELAQRIGINEVGSNLQYGRTTISGTLIKDAALGSVGRFYLAQNDGTYILLNTKDLDNLVGSSVSVYGTLTPPTSEESFPYMVIEQLTTN